MRKCLWFKNIGRNYLSHLILPLIFFLVSIAAYAQSNQIFSNLKVKDGLPSKSIHAVTQDTNGFMWLATVSGLFRYDGYEVVPFKNDRSNTIDYSKGNFNVIKK